MLKSPKKVINIYEFFTISRLVSLEKENVKKNQLKPSSSIQSLTKSSNKILPTDQCNNCCCNFLHCSLYSFSLKLCFLKTSFPLDSLRQVMHDAEQMKQVQK